MLELILIFLLSQRFDHFTSTAPSSPVDEVVTIGPCGGGIDASANVTQAPLGKVRGQQRSTLNRPGLSR